MSPSPWKHLPLLVLLVLGTTLGAACRREHPAIARQATAAAAASATAAAAPPASPTPDAAAAAKPGVAPAPAPAGDARRGKISGGNLGVAATGISAGIQVWSKPGGVLAGGSTMVGTLQDGATVDMLAEEQFLGQKYYRVRGTGSDSTKEGWVDGRFVETQ